MQSEPTALALVLNPNPSPSSAATLHGSEHNSFKDHILADLPPLPSAMPAPVSSKIPKPDAPPLSDVHILLPMATLSGAAGNQFIIDNDEWAGELREFTDSFTKLGASSVEWHRVTLANYRDTVQQIHNKRKEGTLVVNLCDGYETTDGRPGNSVIKLLAAYASIPAELPASSVGPHLWQHIPARPLIVKPDGAYNSIGTTVCRTDEEAVAAVRDMQVKYGRVIVEPFIKGQEYTALVVDDPLTGEPVVFPVMERMFPEQFGELERFMSRDVWNNLRFKGKEADPHLASVLEDVARKAYKAVGGNSYGRVDIRLSPPCLPQVLEVNSLCGLSEDRTSTVGFVLATAGLKIVDVWRLVSRHASERAKRRTEQEKEVDRVEGVYSGNGVQLQ
ncbi:hypothetical protein HDU93_008582 [Gonapodya sp. JEL0774]|nr:hypothetical protein HDU93_008582 [Gonapodya sp. JEL0774]